MDLAIHHTAFAQFHSRPEAEDCIRKLRHQGYDISSLTLIGKGYFSQQRVLGYQGALDRMRTRGLRWAANGGVWGLFFAISYLLLEGYRVVEVFPWLVLYLTACWAFIFGVVGALWGALSTIGLGPKLPLRFSTSFKASTYLVVATGNEQQIDQFRELLDLHLPKDVPEKDAAESVEL